MDWARKLSGTLTYVGVLLGLAGVGYWGHHTHWSFASPAHADESASSPGNDEDTPVQVEPLSSGSALSPIVFDTTTDVETGGIATDDVRVETVDEELIASAVVSYDQTRIAQLAPRVSGHVWSVVKGLGQVVRKGDVIILVDSEEVGAAKAQFLQDSVTASFKKHQFERIKGIGEGVVPERTIREAAAALEEADLRRFNAQQHLVNLGLDVDQIDYQHDKAEDLARQIQFIGIPQKLVDQMNPRPKTANLFPMIAPFDGIVVRQETVLGEMVHPDQCPVTIADIRSMWLKLSLRKEDAQRVEVGQLVTFRGDGLDKAVEGKVTWISPEIDEKTRTVQARAEVVNPLIEDSTGNHLLSNASADVGDVCANPPRRLLSVNQFGMAAVKLASFADAIVVPTDSIQRLMDGTTLVFVAGEDGRSFIPRKVDVGLVDEEAGNAQIRSGISRDDRVVTKGAYILKSELLKGTMVTD